LQPQRWQFFGQLFTPLGVTPFLFPPALLPTFPLAIFSLLDGTGYRALFKNTYAVEYLGFATAASLIGLQRIRPWLQPLAICATTAGLIISLVPVDWQVTLHSAPRFADYEHEVEFASCATQAGPALSPAPSWTSYARGRLDLIWFAEPKGLGDPRNVHADAAGLAAAEQRWRNFVVLIYPYNRGEPGSLVDFADVDVQGAQVGYPFRAVDGAWPTGYFDVVHYAELFTRLPVQVDAGRFRYRGDERLAQCASTYGFPVAPSDVLDGPRGSIKLISPLK